MRLLLGALLAILLPAPSAARPPASVLAQQLDAELARSLQADPSLPGIVATVRAPGLNWSGAAGAVTKGGADRLTPAHAFRLASITKVYTAATVMRLVEQGRLDLFAPIAPLISERTRSLLEGDGYRTDRITLHQLLLHTSGIYDYATSPAFFEQVQADFSRRWSRDEQIALAMTAGDPVGAPGERFHYSDTGYVILGEIIERSTGMPLGQAVAQELGFKRQGFSQTHFERLDPTPPGQLRARQLFGTVDVAGIDQRNVLVNADIKQVRQQADVLAQEQGAVVLRILPTLVIQVRAAAVGLQAQLHAHRIVAREAALVYETQLQSRGCLIARLRAEQHRAGAIGQHPAQEVRIEVGVVAAARVTRALEQARGHLRRDHQRVQMGAQLDR